MNDLLVLILVIAWLGMVYGVYLLNRDLLGDIKELDKEKNDPQKG